MIQALSACKDVKAIDLYKEETVYRISETDYNQFLTKQSNTIAYRLILAGLSIPENKSEARKIFKDIGNIFAEECSFPIEGKTNEEVKSYLANAVSNICTIQNALGYWKMKEITSDKMINNHKPNNEKKKRISSFEK